MSLLTAAAATGMGADTGALTTVHFALIGVLIVLTLIGIAYGARLKRQRAAAEDASEERVEALEEAADEPAGESAVAAEPASPTPPPAAPPPPPPPALPGADATGGYRLSDVKGLGPKAIGLLAAQGVDDLATLASLDAARAAAVDGALGPLSGRLTRDRWVEQARLLEAGDRAGFEATFGKL